jgi:pyruvate dehydrogenase E2 component (dihydrolipoamide acetyltransferase)
VATPVELPKSGNTVEECVISRWVTQTGDIVAIGDLIAEVETDKAMFEITAPVGGTVLATFFEEGALVPVFTTVCVIGKPGEAIEMFRPPTASRHQGSGIRDSGLGIRAQGSTACASAPLSPRARRFAAERAFEPNAVVGSGPGGRVLEQDVREAYESARRPSSTRDIIAHRVRESPASTAQYTLHASAGAEGLLALRAQVENHARSGPVADITINALVTFCTIRALLEMPDLNAALIDGAIVRHESVHIGFACDTPRGLLVPVVRDAHTLAIGALALRMHTLASQAADGSVSPDRLAGATFTISNLGDLAIELCTPVINVPQVAILGVGAIHLKPVRTNGRVEHIDAITLSLTCDHQAIDSASGARFLRTLKDKIEHVEYEVILRG